MSLIRSIQRRGERGYLCLDDVVVEKPFTKLLAWAGWTYSHSQKRHVFGLHIVLLFWCTGHLRIPVGFRLWRPKREGMTPYRTKLELAQDVVSSVLHTGLSFECLTFDLWYNARSRERNHGCCVSPVTLLEHTAMMHSAQSSLETDGATPAPVQSSVDRHPTRHSIIIPAYEEECGLPEVLKQVLSQIDPSYEVIVVDDGSMDNTSAVARLFPCRVIRHDRNQGKGAAVRTGIANSKGVNIVWIDADGTYPADRIPDLVRGLEAGFDLVVTRREYGRSNIPLFNRIGNSLLRLLAVGLYGKVPQDPFTGLYGAKRRHLERMSLSSEGFGIEIEVVVKSARMRLCIGEFPIAYARRIGQTKLNGITAGIEILLTMLRFLRWRPALGSDGSDEPGL